MEREGLDMSDESRKDRLLEGLDRLIKEFAEKERIDQEYYKSKDFTNLYKKIKRGLLENSRLSTGDGNTPEHKEICSGVQSFSLYKFCEVVLKYSPLSPYYPMPESTYAVFRSKIIYKDIEIYMHQNMEYIVEWSPMEKIRRGLLSVEMALTSSEILHREAAAEYIKELK